MDEEFVPLHDSIKKIIVLIVECHGVDTLLLPVLSTVQATNEDCHRLICGSRL
jgi:hypothetical protein